MGFLDVYKNYDHIKELLEWLYEEVLSAGGDGDAIWYSKYYKTEQIKEAFTQFFETRRWRVDSGPDYVFARPDHEGTQEGILITNKQSVFEGRPSWSQVSIVY